MTAVVLQQENYRLRVHCFPDGIVEPDGFHVDTAGHFDSGIHG
jgi:hypothetical protein